MAFRFTFLAAAGCLVGILTPVSAQAPAAVDSAKNLKYARSVQRSFELSRRSAVSGGPISTGRCEERVGQFCYWYDEDELVPTTEPEIVTERRERLMAELDAAARRHPGDGWVTGQRVRYLIEAGLYADAVGVARECRATPWWCAALEGFALHSSERFTEAQVAFDRSLAEMPPGQACAWLDIEPLLESREGDAFHRTGCDDRRAAVDSLLWLGRPAYSRAGNDLFTEFLSRRTMIAMLSNARTPHGTGWGPDAAEILLRYGREVAWRADAPGYGDATVRVVGYERKPAYPFIPVFKNRDDRTDWEWDLRRDRPRMRYSPTYSSGFSPIPEYQLARFPRGDSVAVVVGFSLERDTAFATADLDAALALAGDPRVPPVVSRVRLLRARGGLIAVGRATDWIVSVEGQRSGGKRQVLLRTTIEQLPPSAVAVSDPLLITSGDPPASLEAAAARALPSSRVSRETPVGVYWEITGATGDSLSVTLAVVPEKRGLLARIGEGLTLAKKQVPLAVTYRAPSDGAGTAGRSIEIDFRTVKPGRYRLRLELSAGNGIVRVVDRPLIVE
ncbi:MAG: hypothetical protein ABI647_13035 [Gemmatimonadota bacterium]